MSPQLDERMVTGLRRRLDAHRSMLAVANIVAAAMFVAGCVGFYWPALNAGSVTLFLIGSVLFLFSASASAVLEHGRSD